MPALALECPSCRHPMRPAAGGSGQPWLCDGCGSFFMPAPAFQGLVQKDIAGHVRPRQKGPVHHCPGCKGAMSGLEFEGSDMDLCPACNMVLSGRNSFSTIVEHSPGMPALNKALLDMDVARNITTAGRPETVPRLEVDNLFILYRNGILIASFAPDMPEELDRDIVGSMLMAVTEFVQTSFKGLGGSGQLSCIRFGDREIAFEHGRYLVLALTLRGELGLQTRSKLAAALKSVEASNDHLLRSWDGDLGGLQGLLGSFRHIVEPVRAAC